MIDSHLSAWMHDIVDSFLDLKLVSLEVYLPRRLDVRPDADDAFAAARRLFEDELYPTILDETESMRSDPRFGLNVVMRYSRNGRSSVRVTGSDDCELVADAACARFFSALAPWLGDLSEATFSFHEAQRRSAHERLRAGISGAERWNGPTSIPASPPGPASDRRSQILTAARRFLDGRQCRIWETRE